MQTNHKLDTNSQVFFYEQEFYVLSNFSSFNLTWKDKIFQTSEHAYHWEKFATTSEFVADMIYAARSAHDAFQIAQANSHLARKDWNDVKVDIMRDILFQKAIQHPYVRKKLLETGTRELVEDSWRDNYWGWGPNKDGKNMLGRLWMEVRAKILEYDENNFFLM